MNYMHGLDLKQSSPGERRMVLYIGSSIGNFEPHQAAQILEIIRAGLVPGDTLLLGVDLKKDEATLLAAYDDAAGVTARFNLNLLARLNRELDADFNLEAFAHRAVWNAASPASKCTWKPDQSASQATRAQSRISVRNRRKNSYREQL